MVGGWRQYESAGDIFNIDNKRSKEVISTEIYDEEKSVFRVAGSSDNMESPPNVLYQYYGAAVTNHCIRGELYIMQGLQKNSHSRNQH